ncbi:MAG: ankyrin repeat domain-containing protein, partial [Pseudomonadota bacterium]
MSKSGKDEELARLLNESGFGSQFLIYLEKRTLNPQAVWDDMTDESLKAEFITKCQWIQRYARTKLGAIDTTLETAAHVINSTKAQSFSIEVSGNIFDGFMHFVVANETNSEALNSLMTTWVSQGRSLTELDSDKITPLQTAVYTKNSASFISLAKYDVDITATDGDGFSPLHVIVNKIENGSASISLLEAWLKSGLPTDMVSSKEAKEWAGKTAVEFAEM